ncbi:Beta-galactosidase 15, partial [Mucuna pruriens]
MEEVLTMGSSNKIEYGNMMTLIMVEKSTCFLGNAHSSMDATITFQNTQYTVPAWSVSILPDCYTEEYNTAKLLDQKVLTNDTSDYLWYITSPLICTRKLSSFLSVNITKGDPILSQDIKLRVKTKGHVLHVFVNGRHVGSQYAQYGQYSFTFEAPIKLNLGLNDISLLSGTVSLANYGAHFANVHVGVCGPVQLVSQRDGTEMTKDISKYVWNYKVGIHGENVKLYSPGSTRGWFTNGLPTDRIFMWYKLYIEINWTPATFKTPVGNDPVVIDLKGLRKGQAWVNGNNIGRYHVPNSFLRDGNENTLVLFEEKGGNPYEVIRIDTVTIERACANAYEGHRFELACNVNQLCLGKKKCYIHVNENVLGPTECRVPQNRLAIDAICETTTSDEAMKF